MGDERESQAHSSDSPDNGESLLGRVAAATYETLDKELIPEETARSVEGALTCDQAPAPEDILELLSQDITPGGSE